jgi:cardiolipin synthase
VLGLIALPYLVLPMYLLFGRRKIVRRTTNLSGVRLLAGNWAEQLIASFGLGASGPASVTLHRDGHEAAEALFSVITDAATRLDICTFILSDDVFGREAMQHMMQRARAGVRVRLLIDGVGSLKLPHSSLKQLQAAGIKTAVFSPLFARTTQSPRNLRYHRKLVIADGTRLWAGGRNLSAEYFEGAPNLQAWHDLTFDLRGAAASAAGAQFEEDWKAAGGTPDVSAMSAGQLAPQPMAVSKAQFLPSGPDQTEDTVHALLIDACFHARDRMLAVSPYFVPDVSLETAMRLAARRGVRIDLVLPLVSNHRLADFARNRALRSLSRAGVNIHLTTFMNHAKAVVFDEALGMAGSVNLDSRSLLLNYECAVVFYGAAEIDWLARWITALIPQAQPFDCRPPGLIRDVGEGLLLTVAYQL